MTALLSGDQIDRLVSGQSISKALPWTANDDTAVEGFYQQVCSAVSGQLAVIEKGDWDHYGCGYASFIDAWFFRASSDFDVRRATDHDEEHTGLVVLLSRLSQYYVFMEGEKGWSARGGYSYLPGFEQIDELAHPAVSQLAAQVEPMLCEFGLIRAFKHQLEELLSQSVQIDTNLSDGPLRQFDALFYWFD